MAFLSFRQILGLPDLLILLRRCCFVALRTFFVPRVFFFLFSLSLVMILAPLNICCYFQAVRPGLPENDAEVALKAGAISGETKDRPNTHLQKTWKARNRTIPPVLSCS
jgi:hypothetical protein